MQRSSLVAASAFMRHALLSAHPYTTTKKGNHIKRETHTHTLNDADHRIFFARHDFSRKHISRHKSEKREMTCLINIEMWLPLMLPLLPPAANPADDYYYLCSRIYMEITNTMPGRPNQSRQLRKQILCSVRVVQAMQVQF